jgi:hypothetical protein
MTDQLRTPLTLDELRARRDEILRLLLTLQNTVMIFNNCNKVKGVHSLTGKSSA